MIVRRRQQPAAPFPEALFNEGPAGNRTTFMEKFRAMAREDTRVKPCYADCWLIGTADQLDPLEEYDTPSGHVVIGTAADGETEYNLTPSEYTATDITNAIVEECIGEVRAEFRTNGGRTDRRAVEMCVGRILSDRASESPQLLGDIKDSQRISDIVYRYTVGLGVFDILLADPKLEDLYIDSPCIKNRVHVTLSGIGADNSHISCRTNLLVERREVMNLVNVLKRESGLPFCESSPVLETDMKNYDARATVVGYPMSPNGDAVAIRKRSDRPWTLTRLIANGTVTREDAGLLSFLVQNRATFLICGARGAGKTSLLSALIYEFPLSQRIQVIEDTAEIGADAMRSYGYKVQSMLIDDRMDGDSRSRSAEALRVSLRLGESAIVIGEVRGDEARILYESMRTGRAGSAILGTIHGDSARTVYERVVHDMGIAPEAFMATDILVTIGTFKDRQNGSQVRRLSEIAATTDRAGEFREMYVSQPDFSLPVLRRALNSAGMTEEEVKKDIGARALLHGYLADLSKTAGEKYLSPRWVAAANEHASRMAGKDPADVLASFSMRVPGGDGN